MREIQTISYTDWLTYVRASCVKGRHCDEFKALQCSAPILSGNGCEGYIRNELAKLVSQFIKTSIARFQNSVNKSLEEADVYIFESGIRELKEGIADCLFFDGITGYPADVKKGLKESIHVQFMLLTDEFGKYIKRLMELESSSYADEINYIYQKANMRKFIQERTANE